MKIINRSEVDSFIEEVNKKREIECKQGFGWTKVEKEKLFKSIPSIFKDAWLEDCDERLKSLNKGAYIYGKCGTGKTHSLYAIYRNLKLFDMNCRVINVVELLRLFKKDFADKNSGNFEQYLEYGGVLLLDDIGAERNTEFVEETLYHLINTRYEKELLTIFTGNLSLKELAEKNGDRLVSRIAGMCEVIELKGEDKRIN